MSRAVVKVGTSSLTDEAGVIDEFVIRRISYEAALLRQAGHVVTIVTSGAISAGMPLLGITAEQRPGDPVALQALSSIGQPALVATWSAALAEQGLRLGQILLAPHNFGERTQYLHARATLAKLHELGVVPLINENDAVTDDEIRYGDNDRIAALVAHLVDADTLVLLTDTDGIMTADPSVDPNASVIADVTDFAEIEGIVGGAGSERGSGGMASKLEAAKIASWSGVRTVIANAQRSNVIVDAVNSAPGVGTTVAARQSTLSARKLWIGFALTPVATVVVDEGAAAALSEGGRSLLAVGVAGIVGSFESGDPIEVATNSGLVVARGVARMTSEQVNASRGGAVDVDRSEHRSVVVHVDDLVLLG